MGKKFQWGVKNNLEAFSIIEGKIDISLQILWLQTTEKKLGLPQGN